MIYAEALQASSRSSHKFLCNSWCNTGTNISSVIRVPLHQGSDIKLRLLDHLDLTDVAIFDREDAGCLTLNLFSSGTRNEGLDQSLKVSLSSEGGHGADHLSTDGLTFRRLGVTSLLELIILLLGESDAEHADNVSVRCTGIDVGLNDTLLFLDKRAQLVACHIHTVEVEEAVVSLNILDTKLYLAIGHSFILIKVSKGELDHTSLEAVRSDFLSLGLGNDSLSTLLLGEDGGGDKLVPFFLKKGVDCLLLSALLGLGKSLILSLLI
mmetsp:Transcript_3249/g.5797  ORF Transcript_3249/g.5797 Transcript_3249/m.5797 type:complete len:267 (-) Transcript_3249:508-1308(-)|eukprot:CAMPEP_0201627616 /NCGR_PEP_ID=MMETSP0493-20130528/2752_2 /ASSEMBLY_ACC=CAM_ASM_000838 /TAXON_ID=420259 /ORGANISM="Thalassiosira gravida, Strain GMp14c1" /LENGTH=266 /DNA_ID=CAMNT_0048098121 /DNA_START=47 /DNA_END=847 /DNA_ORIENTATION=-